MPTSPVTFQDKPDDDVCIHLIGNTPGTQTSTTPEDVSSIGLLPGEMPSLTVKEPYIIDFKHYQLVFIRPKRVLGSNFPPPVWFIKHVPMFTIIVSLVQLIVYIKLNPELSQMLQFDPERQAEAYRFLTYMLLHTGPIHLLLNVLLQHILVTPLEIEQGHWRTALLYMGGGFGGALGAGAVEPKTVVEGASAGVYAILMAQVPHMVLNLEDLRYKISRMVVVVILLLADIGHTVYHISINGNTNPRISIPAHAFGAVTGILLGFVIFQGTSKWTTTYQVIAAAILCLLISAWIVHNILLVH